MITKNPRGKRITACFCLLGLVCAWTASAPLGGLIALAGFVFGHDKDLNKAPNSNATCKPEDDDLHALRVRNERRSTAARIGMAEKHILHPENRMRLINLRGEK